MLVEVGNESGELERIDNSVTVEVGPKIVGIEMRDFIRNIQRINVVVTVETGVTC